MRRNTDTIVTENITIYMNDIEKFGRLSRDREAELSRIIMNNLEEKDDAIKELVEHNLKLVVKIAHDFKRFGIGFADLVAEGNIGLMTAASKFDCDKCPKFSVYAAWWIKQAMRVAIAFKSRTIRIPAGAAQKLFLIMKVEKFLENKLNRPPTIEEISTATKIPVDIILHLKQTAQITYSLDEKIKADSETTFADCIQAETTDEEEERDKDNTMSALMSYVGELSDMDKLIIKLFYGIDCKRQLDYMIATEVGMSTKDLKEYLTKILEKLRVLLEKNGVGRNITV